MSPTFDKGGNLPSGASMAINSTGHAIPVTPHNCRLPGTDGRDSGSIWECVCGRQWMLRSDRRGFSLVRHTGRPND